MLILNKAAGLQKVNIYLFFAVSFALTILIAWLFDIGISFIDKKLFKKK
jgi:hypothetical protein